MTRKVPERWAEEEKPWTVLQEQRAPPGVPLRSCRRSIHSLACSSTCGMFIECLLCAGPGLGNTTAPCGPGSCLPCRSLLVGGQGKKEAVDKVMTNSEKCCRTNQKKGSQRKELHSMGGRGAVGAGRVGGAVSGAWNAHAQAEIYR